MNFYFVSNWVGNVVAVRSTLEGARKEVRSSRFSNPQDLVVELRDVPIDKANVLELLLAHYPTANGDPDPIVGPALRRWNVTARRGLKEISIMEEA